jgi:hypothetical protein
MVLLAVTITVAEKDAEKGAKKSINFRHFQPVFDFVIGMH